MTDWHEYNKQKRQKVLDTIKPLCDLFRIKKYDYKIIERSEDGFCTEECLYLDSQKIGCCGKSVEAVFDEAFGYVIINRYCKRRSLGAFEAQTKNFIKRYWID